MTRTQFRQAALLAAMLFLVLGTVPAFASKSLPVIPVSGNAVKVTIAGKEQTYHSVGGTKTIVLEIDGPGRLQCISRLGMQAGSRSTEEYEIAIQKDGSVVQSHTSRTDVSEAKLTSSGMMLGKMRKFSFKIPEGTHTYTITLASPSRGEAFCKFRFTPARGRRNLVTMEALSYDKVVTAVVKEKLITYYVSSGERPVQLKVIGPTRVRVSVRLNYDAKMKGEQRYSVVVNERGGTVLTKALATSKAVGTIYQEWKDVVPGKVNSFTLAVPEGEHVYAFSLGKSLGRSVSFKFSIPKKDLDNEE